MPPSNIRPSTSSQDVRLRSQQQQQQSSGALQPNSNHTSFKKKQVSQQAAPPLNTQSPASLQKNISNKKQNVELSSNKVTTSDTNALVESEAATSAVSTSNDAIQNNNMNSMASGMSSYGNMHGSMYGMGGMYGMGSMYGMGMYGMGGMGGMMGNGPLSQITNALFGFQQLVFALGQAMQVLGMNTQALQQIFHTGIQTFDSTYQHFEDMRQLSLAPLPPTKKLLLENGQEILVEDEEAKKKQRRLKALRWTLLLAVSYTTYKLVYRIMMSKRRRRKRMYEQKTLGNNAQQNYIAHSKSNYGQGGHYPDRYNSSNHAPNHFSQGMDSYYGNPGMNGNYYGNGYGSSAYGHSFF